MKKITLLLFFLISIALTWQTNAQSTINITTSGGSYPGEKWVSITTEADGAGTQVWGQGDGTQCNGSGLINENIMIAPGTYYVNCYDQYDDGWDGTLISVTAYGAVIGDNGGTSPSDGEDTDAASSCEGTAEEFEASFVIVVPNPPACSPPISIVSTPSTTTDTTITWSAGGTETMWGYEWGATGFVQGTGTTGSVMTTPSIDLTGLTPGADYDIYIQANCGGANGDSTFAGPITWRQPNIGDTCDFPISATVEADCSAATQNVIDYTTAVDLGPFSCDTTANNIGAWFEITSPASGAIKFITTGSMTDLAIFETCGSELYCNGSLPAEFSLSGLTPSTVYRIAIWKDSATTGTSDVCFEEVNCLFPTGLTANATGETTADLTWTAGGTESAWEYVVQVDGTGTPTGAGTASATPSASATGLVSDTAYEVYVRADCGGGSYSEWFGPVDFTTPATPASVPYSYDFSGFPDMGWTQAGSGNPTTGPTGTTSGWSTQNYANDAASSNGLAASVNLWSSNNQQEWLISAPIDLMAAGTYYLNMDVAVTAWNAAGPSAMGSDDEVQVLISTDGGTGWTNLFTWNAGNAPGNAREAAGEIDISPYAGNNVLIAIWATDGAVDDPEDYDFFVDNFQITTASLNTDDVIFEDFTYFPNPVTNILSLKAQDNIQSVTVFNMLGQEVMRSSPNSLENEIDMSSLQTGAYFLKVKINDVEGDFRIIKE